MVFVSVRENRKKAVLEVEEVSNYGEDYLTTLLIFCHFHQLMWGVGGILGEVH